MEFTLAAASEPQAQLFPKTAAVENLRNGSQDALEGDEIWLFSRI